MLDLTPKIDLTRKVNAALRSAGFSLKDTAAMSDKDLLGIAGIGRRTLRLIRILEPPTRPRPLELHPDMHVRVENLETRMERLEGELWKLKVAKK